MSVEVTISITPREVTVDVDQTTRTVTVDVIQCTTTSEFKYLLDKKFKAGVEADLLEGWNQIEFTKPFDDDDYNVRGDGYNGINKVEAVIGEQTAEFFWVYLPDNVASFRWEAINHN